MVIGSIEMLWKSWRLITLFGTCQVSTYSFLATIAVLAVALTGRFDVLWFWGGLWVAALVHSLGHAMMARLNGEVAESVVLYPFFSTFKLAEPPVNMGNDFLITLAGPLVNLATGGLFYFMAAGLGPESPSWLMQWSRFNLWYGVITILPMYPLDGARVLRLLLNSRMDQRRALSTANFVGQSMAAAILLWSFYQGFYRLGFIGIFFYLVGRGAPLFQVITRQMNMTRAQEDLQMEETEEDEWPEGEEAPIVMVQTANGTWEPATQTTAPHFRPEGRTFF